MTVKNNLIHFIDFGLAKIIEACDLVDLKYLSNTDFNLPNMLNHIELIDMIKIKFESIVDLEQQHIYYNNLINNLKLDKDSKYKENIF